MPSISISVKNKIAVQTNRTLYVCGNSDYTALFDLDAEWNAFEIKTARFCYNGHYSDVIFTGNECEIPAIADTNEFEIGLFAGNLHTTTPAMVLCERSILSTLGSPADPSPDVYHQLIEKIDSGMLRGPQGEQGPAGPRGDPGPAGPQGEKGDTGPAGADGKDGAPGKDAPQIDDGVVSDAAPWSSRKIIETLCPPLEVTGNPVTCEPVAGYPLGVAASWEPTQAGSGEPYPAGGGPNLLDISKCTAASGGYGVVPAIVGDTITLKGTVTGTSASGVSYMRILNVPDTSLSGKNYKITAFAVKGSVNYVYGLTTADDTSIAASMNLTVGQTVDVALRIMVSKDTPTAYAPYENIRPISGREAVSVTRCERNLLDISRCRPVDTGGAYGLTVTISGDTVKMYGIPIISADLKNAQFRVLFTDQKIVGGYKCKGFAKNGRVDYLYTISPADKSIVIVYPLYKDKLVDDELHLMYYYGSTPPTEYTPYRGDTLALALPSTVYGGSLDVVTGAGAENYRVITLDGVAAKFDDTPSGIYWNMEFHSAPGITGIFAISHFANRYFAFNTKYDFICGISARLNEFFATIDDLNAYLAAQYAAGTPVQIAYKLAEPVPFQATGNGPLLPIPGETNTVMTDADSITVTGRADPIRIIQQLQAAQSVATQQLAEAQQQIVDTTAAIVDYVFEQDCDAIGGGEDADAE